MNVPQGRPATVGDAGEFATIARITARLGSPRSALLGPGDDAAVLGTPDGRVAVSTDLLVEGRHFRRSWSGGYDIGRKAAAANLADIAAMGGVPTGLLVGLGAPPELPLSFVEELADGLREECGLVGAEVVGGDLVRADAVLLAVTALGDLQGRDPVTRGGASAGDQVALAGRLGWAAAGLAVLRRGFRAPGRLVAAHRRPEPPYAAGPQAAALGATAMIDVSDGLVADLRHVAAASGVRIDLARSALVADPPLVEVAGALSADPYDWVFGGGDDHALAATFPAGASLPAPWRVVGRVLHGEGVTVDGEPYDRLPGHDHFAPPGRRG